MDEILQHWRLAFFPTLTYCGVGFAGTLLLQKSLNELGGALRSAADLPILRRAINVNMALAVSLFVLISLYTLALTFYLLAGWFSFTTFIAYSVFLTTAAVPFNKLYFVRVERRARNLPVFSHDPEVEATYRRWLKEWSEPRLQLSPEPDGRTVQRAL